jgi:SAM-dependent methyltransferase
MYSYGTHSGNIPGNVAQSIRDAEQVESRLLQKYGDTLESLDMLEIGPGQYLSQMIFFLRNNRVVGIDLDVIAYGNKVTDYTTMLRINGARRTAKTLGRKLLGIDARYRKELFRQLGIIHSPRPDVIQMDASQMDFVTESFDCVYSRAVFHHLPEPGKAIAEIVRVLRPGGLVYVTLHPYTNPSGCLDPRLLAGGSEALGMWPHLRPEAMDRVRSNACLNKLSIPQWQRLFEAHMHGVNFILTPCAPETLDAARTLHQQGKLADYSLDELTTGEFVAMWKKPISAG